MAALNYGDGTGDNDSSTTSGYSYTAMLNGSIIETFDGTGDVDTIKLYNLVSNGRLRIWKGTVSGLVFTFDDFTEDVDVDLTGKGTGWITLNAPADFASFSVTAATALLFYAHSTTSEGTMFGRGASGTDKYGYNAADPPYSGDLTMIVGGVSDQLEVKLEGTLGGGGGPLPRHQMIL